MATKKRKMLGAMAPNIFRTQCAGCGLALFYWNICQVSKIGHTTGCKISEMLQFAFKLLSIQTTEVHIAYPIVAQTITPSTGCLC